MIRANDLIEKQELEEEYDSFFINTEEDIPPIDYNVVEERISEKDVRNMERIGKVATDLFRLNLKIKSLHLVIFLIVILLILLIGDTIVLNYGYKTSQLLASTNDLLALILTTALGYAFAESKK